MTIFLDFICFSHIFIFISLVLTLERNCLNICTEWTNVSKTGVWLGGRPICRRLSSVFLCSVCVCEDWILFALQCRSYSLRFFSFIMRGIRHEVSNISVLLITFLLSILFGLRYMFAKPKNSQQKSRWIDIGSEDQTEWQWLHWCSQYSHSFAIKWWEIAFERHMLCNGYVCALSMLSCAQFCSIVFSCLMRRI